jgi:hypothetical protein
MRRAILVILSITGCGDDDRPGGDPDALAPLVDAASDARSDAPPGCDYGEQDDERNGGFVEPTGLTLPERMTICGRIDPRAPTSGVIDLDNFGFRVAPSGDYAIRLVAPGADRVRELRVELWGIPDGFYGWAGSSGGRAFGLLWFDLVHEDIPMALRVYGFDDTELAEPIDYQIEIAPIDLSSFCVDPGGVADVTEAADGVDSTGNDMLTYNWPPMYGLTASGTDLPEETGLVLAAGQTATIEGVAGLHDLTDLYRDRDTFAFEAAADVGEVRVRLVWDDAAGTADDADIDAFMFRPDVDPGVVPQPLGSAQNSSLADDDLMAAAVLPGARHLAMVPASSAAGVVKPYRLVLCAAPAP